MTKKAKSGRGSDGRFSKGHSGNPKGRAPQESKQVGFQTAFEIFDGRTVKITIDGEEREMPFEHALLYRVVQDAFAGKRLAQRKVLKWILEREEIIGKRRRKKQREDAKRGKTDVKITFLRPPRAIDDVLDLLGLVSPGKYWFDPDGEFEDDLRILLPEPEYTQAPMLEHWAVQAALNRDKRRRRADESARKNIERRTHDSSSLQWPKRYQND